VTNPRIHAIIVKYLWTISFLLVTVFLVFSVCPAGQFKVYRVTDGDTITVRDGSVEKIIRLVGIDAPEVSHKKRETGQPFSQQPTKYLAGLVLNQTVEIKEYGQDRYGRTLGVVLATGKSVNLEMVKAGYAEVYRGNPAAGFDSCSLLESGAGNESGEKGDVGSGGKIR